MSEAAPEGRPSDGADPARRLSPDAPPDADLALPIYKGAPLDAGRGPGLGCFWIQVALLAALLIATPISVWLAAEPWISATLLLISLGLLFFVGQTSIFLLRLVAADRRAQRRPLRQGARPTVGQLSRNADLSPEASADDDARSSDG